MNKEHIVNNFHAIAVNNNNYETTYEALAEWVFKNFTTNDDVDSRTLRQNKEKIALLVQWKEAQEKAVKAARVGVAEFIEKQHHYDVLNGYDNLQNLLNAIKKQNQNREGVRDMPEDREPTAEEKTLTGIRNEIRDLGKVVLQQKVSYAGRDDAFEGQTAEMRANVMLAYRHLEDARMRIGKVMQQIQGGVSIFDKPEQEAVKEPG